MNQILNSEPNFNKNNNIKPKENKPKKEKIVENTNNIFYDQNQDTKSVSSDKLVKVFAVLLIIFALCLIGAGAYTLIQNKENVENLPVQNTPTAEITAEEENGKIKIVVSDKSSINQLVYSWNGQKENKVQGEGKNIEKYIDLPAGTNNLIISVINVDGVETTFEKVFESENGLDIINPVISLEVVNAKLVIKATDESAMDFITYRWNDDEEKTVTPEENNKKEIKVELEIEKGENDITVVAVDKNNNTTTETKTYKGVTVPEIIIVLSSDESSLDITCKHEKGIKRVEYTLNDQQYEGNFDDSPTSVQFTQPLDVGYNRIVLTAISVDDTKYTFDGETTYYPRGYSGDNTNTTDTNTTITDTNSTNTTNTTNTTNE